MHSCSIPLLRINHQMPFIFLRIIPGCGREHTSESIHEAPLRTARRMWRSVAVRRWKASCLVAQSLREIFCLTSGYMDLLVCSLRRPRRILFSPENHLALPEEERYSTRVSKETAIFPPVPAGGVTEQHVHLGGSVSIYRLWEMGQMRGIRGLGNYEEFISQAHLRPDSIHSLVSHRR